MWGEHSEDLWRGAASSGSPVTIYAPDRVAELRRLIRRFPDLPFVIDHATLNLYKDSDPNRRFDRWSDVLALAALNNVAVKVPDFWRRPKRGPRGRDPRQRFLEILEAFGADRLMWGSNYPPGARVGTYSEATAFVSDISGELSDRRLTATRSGAGQRCGFSACRGQLWRRDHAVDRPWAVPTVP